MNLPGPPLVLTKLRVPALRARVISRARLIDLLAPKDGAGLVLVCAPAGYGKTTLLTEWAQSLTKNGAAVAWVALDAGDDDPIPFGSYLIASLVQALGPTSGLAQIAQILRSSPQTDLLRILPAAINAIDSSGRECVLILDDYHVISAPAIHAALAYLLEHLSENLRIAIGSRSNPPLPLARLRGRGQLLEIRTAALRFREDETARFLNEVMQLGLGPEGVAALEERTEGWAAGLQLAALSLSNRADKEQAIAAVTGSHRYLVEYLMEEVFGRQPEAVQSFLLSTSILERMCAPLCDRIRGHGVQQPTDSIAPVSFDSEAVLEHLEKSNLFLVPLDDDGTWYRYHHLFRDFLRARLDRTQPERTGPLRRAACEWLAEQGYLREAAHHAFGARDWEYAAAFVEQHSFSLIIHSDMSTLYQWCSAFPDEVMQRHPMLCLQQGLALAYSFRRQNRARVEALLQRVDQAIASLADGQAVSELNEFAAVVHTFLAFAPDPAADPQELLTRAQRMLDNYPEGDPGQFTGRLLTGYTYLALQDVQLAGQALEAARQIALAERLYFGIVESSFNLARLAHNQGQLRRAAEICRQGQATIGALMDQSEQKLPALGSLDIELGCVLLEQDRLDEAEQHLRRGLNLALTPAPRAGANASAGGGMHPHYLMTAYVALFRLAEIRGRSAEALKHLDSLAAAWPDVAFCTDGLRCVHALRVAPDDPAALAAASNWRRDFSSARRSAATPPGMGPFGAAEAYYLADLAWVRVQIARGNTQAARSYLAPQLELAKAHGLAHRVIELSLLEAQAWRVEGDHPRARAALERSLALAQPEGHIRIFDQGPALARLLTEAAQHSRFRETIERLLSAVNRVAVSMPEALPAGQEIAGARAAQLPYGESLSARELEVLRLITRGATNRDIAGQLVITEGTVKSHISHILGKLGAHNRTEAVARARDWGFVDS